jgi:hypothetical protein
MGEGDPKSAGNAAIAVQLLGGMGNQMFQAAAGLALARRHRARLMMDLSRFRLKGLRAYALQDFRLDAELRAEPALWLERLKRRLRLARVQRPPWWHGPIYAEPGYAHDPAFQELPAPILIAGYFQSPHYFAPIADEIATLFAPEQLATREALQQAEALAGEKSVAVHIRLGDYASNQQARAVHGVLPPSYYEAAIARVRTEIAGARFFFVSDDVDAARAFAARQPDAEALAGQHAGDDLFLMSRARHHIIANSSFSWWSAWLDRRPGGLRIAPRNWFTPEAQKSRPTHDLIPTTWIRL